MKKKFLIMAVAMALVCAFAVGMTVAYLTSTQTVTNTFTVGNVQIKLDEANTDEYGNILEGRTETGNRYKLLPGHTYAKDPTVTVLNGSEESYVRMKVTVTNYAELQAIYAAHPDKTFLPEDFVNGTWDSAKWVCQQWPVTPVDGRITLEFRYFETVNARNGDVVLDDLFETITVPDWITNAELATLRGLNINVVAEAIQADGFVDENGDPSADLAWNAFDQQ